jgi:ribose-phosphate pyrophosphokinase
VFTAGAQARLDASPIQRVLVTDTVENQPEPFSDKVEVVSVAPLFAEAIRRIHQRESLGEIFAT